MDRWMSEENDIVEWIKRVEVRGLVMEERK